MSKNINFDKVFKNTGKQGIVGLMKNENDKKFVFKFSQYMNYLVRHEFEIMTELSKISNFCPNFCSPIAVISKYILLR